MRSLAEHRKPMPPARAVCLRAGKRLVPALAVAVAAASEDLAGVEQTFGIEHGFQSLL